MRAVRSMGVKRHKPGTQPKQRICGLSLAVKPRDVNRGTGSTLKGYCACLSFELYERRKVVETLCVVNSKQRLRLVLMDKRWGEQSKGGGLLNCKATIAGEEACGNLRSRWSLRFHTRLASLCSSSASMFEMNHTNLNLSHQQTRVQQVRVKRETSTITSEITRSKSKASLSFASLRFATPWLMGGRYGPANKETK